MHAAIAFPVTVVNDVCAVLEFYSGEAIARDERFLDAMQNVGMQLGRVIERKRLEKQLAEQSVVERQDLGHELHDTLGQQMTAFSMLAAALRDELAAAPDDGNPRREGGTSAAELLDKLEVNVEESKQKIRSLLEGLSPVDVEGGGLAVALERLAAETTATHRVTCRFECEPDVPSADGFAATQLYLIAREATHNAVKHASADEIVIRLTDDGARVTVTDDGRGLPAHTEHSPGRGISIMRYRVNLIGAELRLESPPTGGTIVSCFLQGGEMTKT